MGAAVAVPLVLSALSAGASAYNTRKVQNEQSDIAAQGMLAQRNNQQEADAQVAEGVGQLERSSPEAAQKEATDAFLSQLRRSRDQAVGESGIGGDEFKSDMGQVQKDVTDYGVRNADVQGRINAPGLQRQQEGVTMGRVASNLNRIGRASNADQFLTQLRMGSVQANPWVNAGAQIGGGVASGLAGSGATPRQQRLPQGQRYTAPAVDSRGFA
jgi:hypothetical protein